MIPEDLFRKVKGENVGRTPDIIEDTWQGVPTSEPSWQTLHSLWGETYARLYGWTLGLGVTSRLWEDFGKLASEEFKRGLVFDAGTGGGDIARRVLATCPEVRVVGGDWSMPFLRRAQRGFRGSPDAGRLALCHLNLAKPWPEEWSGQFLGVMCNYVAAYLSLEAQKNILSESFRILAEGGVLLYNFMVKGIEFRDVIKHNSRDEVRRNPLNLVKALVNVPVFTRKVDKARAAGIMESFSIEEFERSAREIGFEEVAIHHWNLPLPEGKHAVPTYRLVK